MSRIKTEIDRALEYYGDDATVFRVVRRAMRVYGPYRYELWPKSKKPFSLMGLDVFALNKAARKKTNQIMRHLRRLLPNDANGKVYTETVRKAMEESNGAI